MALQRSRIEKESNPVGHQRAFRYAMKIVAAKCSGLANSSVPGVKCGVHRILESQCDVWQSRISERLACVRDKEAFIRRPNSSFQTHRCKTTCYSIELRRGCGSVSQYQQESRKNSEVAHGRQSRSRCVIELGANNRQIELDFRLHVHFAGMVVASVSLSKLHELH